MTNKSAPYGLQPYLNVRRNSTDFREVNYESSLPARIAVGNHNATFAAILISFSFRLASDQTLIAFPDEIATLVAEDNSEMRQWLRTLPA